MIKAIVTDVEGTTSSLSFVKELFAFVHAHRQDPAVRAHLDEVSAMVGRSLSEAAAVAQLEQWIDEDKKLTPLKALQGMIWEEGYRRGDFTGHVYDDAVRQLRHWKERGIRLYVFSSGSVQAQRLLFGYSDHGDLMPLFSGCSCRTSKRNWTPLATRACKLPGWCATLRLITMPIILKCGILTPSQCDPGIDAAVRKATRAPPVSLQCPHPCRDYIH
jgi:hypothetical protein